MSTQGYGSPEMPQAGSAWSDGGTTSESGQTTTKDAAKEQARGVAQEGVEGGKHVASVATGEAKEVASEALEQGKALIGKARTELMDQVTNQQSRAADQLHSFSKQLGSMASSAQQEGLAKDLAQQASRQVGKVAHWLSERDPSALGSEVKGFAQKKPGAFLAMSAGIGMLAGRMTRGAKAGPPQSSNGSVGYEEGQPSALRQRMGAPHATTPDYPAGTVPGGVRSYSDDPLAGDPMTRRDPLAGDPLANDPLAPPRTTGLTP